MLQTPIELRTVTVESFCQAPSRSTRSSPNECVTRISAGLAFPKFLIRVSPIEPRTTKRDIGDKSG